jgi:c-di-GMP-binding flagellar brake protein YcgR
MQANSHSELENWHDFTVQSRREIVTILRSVGEKKQLVRILIHGEADVCVTSVLKVDPDDDQLIMDCSIDPDQNKRILAASKLGLETSLDKIRIMFNATGIRETKFEGGPALMMPIPESLIRLQRREYYRMPTPVSNPVRALITMPEESGGEVENFPLADISCGGVALLDNKMILDNTIGQVYANCRIDLPEVGMVTTNLEIRSTHDLTLLNDKQSRRLGCQFVNISRGNLAAVQKYITKLERERNARIAGLS